VVAGGADGAAATLDLTIEVPAPTLRQDARGYTHAEIAGYTNLGEPGAPALPSRTVLFALPAGEVAGSWW